MKVSRSTDNSYMCSPSTRNHLQSCLIYKVEETKIMNMKLAHLNLKSMRKIIVEKDIVGIPDLKIEKGKVYGDC